MSRLSPETKHFGQKTSRPNKVQLIVLNAFNDALERRQDYQKQLDGCQLFRVKMAKMESYVIETKERWRVKF